MATSQCAARMPRLGALRFPARPPARIGCPHAPSRPLPSLGSRRSPAHCPLLPTSHGPSDTRRTSSESRQRRNLSGRSREGISTLSLGQSLGSPGAHVCWARQPLVAVGRRQCWSLLAVSLQVSSRAVHHIGPHRRRQLSGCQPLARAQWHVHPAEGLAVQAHEDVGTPVWPASGRLGLLQRGQRPVELDFHDLDRFEG